MPIPPSSASLPPCFPDHLSNRSKVSGRVRKEMRGMPAFMRTSEFLGERAWSGVRSRTESFWFVPLNSLDSLVAFPSLHLVPHLPPESPCGLFLHLRLPWIGIRDVSLGVPHTLPNFASRSFVPPWPICSSSTLFLPPVPNLTLRFYFVLLMLSPLLPCLFSVFPFALFSFLLRILAIRISIRNLFPNPCISRPSFILSTVLIALYAITQ